MKNTKSAKIITLVLSCLLLVSAAVGIAVSAEETPTVEIKAKNLSYEGAIKILYAVDAQNVPEGAEVKMYFYNENGGELAYEKAAHTEDITINNVTYKTFFSDGIAPKSMRTPLYAKAVVADAEGAILAESAVAEYSIWQYATNRFSSSPSEDQLVLYTAMLDYGASVQKMLVESEKMTEADVIDAGGWIDAYCGIRQDTVYNGETAVTGDVTFYRKGEEIALSADNMYGTDGVFADITDSEGNSLTTGAYPKAAVKTTKAGVTVYSANYDVTGYTFTTFDDLCIDGSENDVNILYKGATGYTAQNAFGTYVVNATFGNDADAEATGYQRVVADSTAPSNNVYLVGSNGASPYNALAYALDHPVEYADKYVMQFDLNWIGRTDTNGDIPTYFRIENRAISDTNDLALLYIKDSGTESDTFTFNGVTLNKNQKYTIRFEITPINRAYYDMDMYVDGVLAKASPNVSPATYTSSASGASNDVKSFIGMRFFNRVATDYSYEVDNVYVGVEGEYTGGDGKYANNTQTHKFADGTAASDYTIHGTPTSAKVENGVFSVGQNSIALKNAGTKTGTKYVYETDIMFNAAPATKSGDNIGWWGLSAGERAKGNHFAAYTFQYTAADGKIATIKINRNDGSTATLTTIYPNAWYNMRIEYTPTTEYQGIVEFYINGRLITSYTANGYANAGNVTNAQFCCVGHEFRSTANSGVSELVVSYANTYLGAETVYTPGNGAYYTDAEKLGTKYDCASLDGITFGMNGETASTTSSLQCSNGKLSIKHTGSGNIGSSFGIANKPVGEATELATGNVHVFETDIRFTGGYATGGGDLNMGWLGMSSNGFGKGDFFLPLALYGVKDENGIMAAYEIIDHKKDGVAVATLTTGEWYNLRFVYTANSGDEVSGTVEVFVNNASVYEYTTSGYSVSDSDTEPNNVFTQFGFQFRSRDASGIGWFDVDMDNIYLGTFDTTAE